MSSESRKRPRPVVSCLRCREKKLKCDRVAPCQNCVKGGFGAQCTYHQQQQPHADPADHQYSHLQGPGPQPKRTQIPEADESDPPTGLTQPVTGLSVGIIEDLQQRVLKLESLHAVRPQSPHARTFDPIRDALVQNSWPRPDISRTSSPHLGTLVVKGSRSRYHGQNDRITLLNQFPEAKVFINQSLNNPSLVGLAKEVQFLQNKSQTTSDSPASLSGLENFPELQNLTGSLPGKVVCDQLLFVYTKNLEKTLRVLHTPSFLAHYNTFWATSDHDMSFLSMFIPLLTAVLSISVIFDPTPPSSEYYSSWNYLKQHAVGTIQSWLRKLPRKPRTELATLQVETLLFMACQLRQVSAEQLWKESGSLVRSAMVMGLHVNTSQSKTPSPYQAECRRRLWVTIVELDLQTSIAAGMPVMTPALDFSPLIPSNLNDTDFDESTTELPTPRSMEVETDTLAQIILAQSLARRIQTMNLVQHTKPRENIEERIKQGQVIEEYLQKIPIPLKLSYDGENSDPAFRLGRVLLDVYIRRPLLSLYRPVLANHTHDGPPLLEIQRASLESSIIVLSYQDLFDPIIADLDLPNSNTYWNIFQTFCQNDILWAALSVCEHLKFINQQTSVQSPSNNFAVDSNNNNNNNTIKNHNNPTKPHPPNNNHTTHSLTSSKASLTRLIENTIDSLTRRIGEKGTNVKDVLLLSVVLQSVRARGPSEQKERHMSQGAKKALSACRQNLLTAANENNFPFQLNGSAPPSNYESTDSILPPGVSGQLGQSSPSMADLQQQSAALAAEFDSFQTDLFNFDDESFMWNI
ncbi:hypothetical protein N7466_003842 [Penicillium verhagenii]|uniref:uncharacterized protein n=1 Tax=Penicillium verhagenii TaxID=1562060 RepID=UPI0025453597|nr:uncharacterized protein N7466_003842 [Penicillium verhagenii]KAJ5934295.1 hypothetical protein N7466_003842 [Penicillium verhagenii]